MTSPRRKESLRGWLRAGIWFLAVIACPTTLTLLAIAHESSVSGPRIYDRRLFVAIGILGWGQVAVAAVAAIAVCYSTRDWHLRLMAWIVAGLALCLTWLAVFGAGIAVTGVSP